MEDDELCVEREKKKSVIATENSRSEFPLILTGRVSRSSAGTFCGFFHDFIFFSWPSHPSGDFFTSLTAAPDSLRELAAVLASRRADRNNSLPSSGVAI